MQLGSRWGWASPKLFPAEFAMLMTSQASIAIPPASPTSVQRGRIGARIARMSDPATVVSRYGAGRDTMYESDFAAVGASLHDSRECPEANRIEYCSPGTDSDGRIEADDLSARYPAVGSTMLHPQTKKIGAARSMDNRDLWRILELLKKRSHRALAVVRILRHPFLPRP